MENEKAKKRSRITRLKQSNPVACPPAVYDHIPTIQRKVGQAGAIHIGGLQKGTRVTIVQIDQDIYLVSGRPQEEVQRIAQQVPKSAPSPFAMVSENVRGLPHDDESPRMRHPYTGISDLPEISDSQALARADLRRTQRVR